jgi:hypothetical protein
VRDNHTPWLRVNGLLCYPFRVLKESDTTFVILIASADEKPDEKHPKAFDDVDIIVRYGDYSSALKKAVGALSEAKKHAGASSRPAAFKLHLKGHLGSK